MSLFYFHLVTAAARSEDIEGIDFPTLEVAYLDACKAALEISFEALRRRQDPSGYRFEVCDENRRLVLDLPFSEVLKPGGFNRAAPLEPLYARIQERLLRGRELKAEIAAGLVQARRSMETAKATLRRRAR